MGGAERTTLTTAGVRIPAVIGAPGSLIGRLVALVVAGTMLIVFGVVANVSPVRAAPGNLVMVTADGAFGVPTDAAKRTLFQSFGWTVTAIDDDSSAATYAAAAASNDVMYFSDTTGIGSFAVRDLDIGLVFDRFGVWGNVLYGTDQSTFELATTVDVVDTSHYITAPFSAGALTIYSATDDVNGWDSSATALPAGVTALAESSTNAAHDTLLIAEAGADLYSAQQAPNRRVFLPGDSADPANYTTDYETILERSLDWAAGFAAPPGPAVVNSSGDASDSLAGDGICDTGLPNADGEDECTLRAAIQEANASATLDTIHFDIPIGDSGHTAGVWTIAPGSKLPTITAPITIDGTSHPDFAADPIVALDGGGTIVNGLDLDGGNSEIRGLVIHSFADEGIDIQVAGGNTIAGNWIGLLPDGATAAGNADDGVAVRTDGNTVGGPNPADRNVISANGNEGVFVMNSDGNTVEGNYLGTDATGRFDRGNADEGLDVSNANGTIVRDNVIAGNDGEGVQVLSSDGGVFTGNLIGVAADGVTPLGNMGDGVTLNFGDSVGVVFGGTGVGDGNTIAYNGDEGVSVFGATTDDIASLGNSIHSNGSLGWDFGGDGVTANDVGDADGGVNDLMNFPVITSFTSSGGTVDVDFDLDLTPGNYRVEFFDNPTGADASGYGEGHTLVASTTIAHTGSGVESFTHSWSGSADVLTASTTEEFGGGAYGSTSEFSLAVGSVTPIAVDDPGDVPSEIAALAPLSYLRLGETSGTSASDGGSVGIGGTYVGDVGLGVPGALAGDADTAADFDGVDDYVVVPHDTSHFVDQGAVSLWIRPDTLGTLQSPISKDSNNFDDGGHIRLQILATGALELRMQTTTSSHFATSTTGLMTVGDWHHVALTFGGRGMEVWLDGQLVATDPYTGGLGLSAGGAGNLEPWVIGADTHTSGDLVATPVINLFDGRIDEVGLFDAQLDAATIRSLAGAGLQSYEVATGAPLSVSASTGVLVNDYDIEGDAITAVLEAAPSNAASFALALDGSFTYRSTAGFTGTDTFTYRADDGTGQSLPATVTITVVPAVTVVVNSTGDAADTNPGDGVCDTGGTNSEGADECTLRAAIEEANASATIDAIHFGIPDSDPNHLYHRDDAVGGSLSAPVATSLADGSITDFDADYPVDPFSWWNIQVTGNLPDVNGNVTIDGTTQPGWRANTATGGAARTTILPIVITSDGGYIMNVEFSDVTIRGLNLSSTAGGPGTMIYLDGVDHVIEGSWFMVDPLGIANGSGDDGIWVVTLGSGSRIGGPAPEDHVLIGNGFSNSGLTVVSDQTLVENVWIGAQVTGDALLPGHNDIPFYVDGNDNIVRDLVVSSSLNDILIVQGDRNTVQGSSFGFLPDGTASDREWADIGGNDNLIGGAGAGEGNRFGAGDDNTRSGIVVSGGTGNSVLGNTVVGALATPIDIAPDGVNPNDAGDVDIGDNDLLNHPVITLVTPSGGTATVDYQLDVPAGDYRIEFYADDTEARNPDGYGAGEVFVGSDSITHTGSGVETFQATITDLGDYWLAATATADLGGGDYGSTSEFGPTECVGDTDGDGLCDRWELLYDDTDGDGQPNRNDADDDDDGIPTGSESADPDGDGDPRDALDVDRDGQPDWLDAPTAAAAPSVGWEQKLSDTAGDLTAALADGDNLGSGVGSIGDLDGDGVVDLVVGAGGDAGGGSSRGAVYVLLMNADGTVRSEQKIGSGVGGLAATLADGDTFGSEVAGVGDIDGDGVPDIVVAADQDDTGGSSNGAIYVLFLNADGTVRDEQKIAEGVGGLAEDLNDNSRFGAGLSGLGDLDGDGVNDIAVGASGDDTNGAFTGAIYVLFLNPDGTVKAEQKITHGTGGLSATIAAGDTLSAVAGIGDLDGDGVEDLVAGAYAADDGGPERGAIHVLFMNTDGTVKGERKISDITGGLAATLDDSDFFGISIGAIGDYDADGAPDIAVGATWDDDGGGNAGAIYLLGLSTDGTVKTEQKITEATGGLDADLDSWDLFGGSIAGVGDLDGNGTMNLLVGAAGDDDGGDGRGAVHLLDLGCVVDTDGDGLLDCAETPYGDTDGDTQPNWNDADDDGDGIPTASENADPNADGEPRDAVDTDRDGEADWLDPHLATGATPIADEQKISDLAGGFGGVLDDGDKLGLSTAAIGDLNRDGVVDIIVGTEGDDDGGSQAGSVYVVFLNADGTVQSERKISALTGGLTATIDAGDGFGVSVASLGDVDGDGVVDVAVGAMYDDDGGTDRGAVHILFLNTDGTVKAERKISALSGGLVGPLGDADKFGRSVAGLGDLDGDGIPDLAVGAIGDGATVERGALYVLFLDDDGSVKTEQKIDESVGGFGGSLLNGTWWGAGLTSPGDIDGDGVVDLAVGSFSDDGGTQRGAVDILFLNTDGTVAGETRISDTAGGGEGLGLSDADWFGEQLGPIGDVDGDGTPDLLASAAGDDTGGSASGAFYILRLSDTGTLEGWSKIDSSLGGVAGPIDVDDNFGYGLAGLGDLDGDGAVNLVVPALRDDDGGPDRGALYVFDLAGSSATLVVNSTGDGSDAAPGDGLCETATAGECTLRAAIEESNAALGGAIVEFGIPTSDPGYAGATDTFTIAPGSLFPSITSPITIDGSTQPEAGALPAIVIDGAGIGPTIDAGLSLDAGSDGSRLHALTVHSYPGHAVRVDASDQHVLTGLVLGLEADGTTPAGNRYGIYADDAKDITIGGDTAAERNVIAANDWGIALYNDSTNATITGNYVGTDHTGLLDRGNLLTGIFVVNSSSYARIGGPTVGEANVVAGNGANGIYVGSGTMLDPLVEGNIVGLGADGTTELPNDQSGIVLAWGSGGIVRDNVVGPNGFSGLELTSHDDAIVQGNVVGTDAGGTATWTLGQYALSIGGSVDRALIGGTGAGEANTFANATLGGVVVDPAAGVDNTVVGNSITANGPIAIDLGADGVTQNDAGDVDAGPNDLLNRPALGRAEEVAGTVSMDVLADLVAGSYRIEIFDGVGEGPFGEGGGGALLHAFDIAHTGSGLETFPTSFAGAAGEVLTATVTEGTTTSTFGSTSEFSYATTVVAPTTLVVNSTDDDVDAVVGDGVCDTGQANALGLPECTLRAAVDEANATGTTTAIHLEIPDVDGGYRSVDGYWVIAPAAAPLSPITAPALVLDATTQPTWVDAPVIELDGSAPAIDLSADGIGAVADGVVVRGWSVTNWPDDGVHTPNDGVVITRNWLGVDPAGTPAPNGQTDLVIYNTSSGVVVGGSTPADGNVIAAAGGADGVVVTNAAGGAVIRNNRFGVGADGVTDLGAVAEAIDVVENAAGTVIDQNLFAHLPNAAIVQQGDATGTVITANTFGLDGNGDPAPVDMAVWTNASGTIRFGGSAAGEGNTVVNAVSEAIGNANLAGTVTILGNSIVDSGLTAIDIGWDGRTTNDSPDVDGVLNHPDLTAASSGGGTTFIEFDLDAPAGDYRIEFFANPSGADVSGFGEGEAFVHAVTITHAGTGSESFLAVAGGSVGDILTATATIDLGGGSYGATSEFSNAVTTTLRTVATVNSTGDLGDSDPGDEVCATGLSNAVGHPECTLRAAIEEANAAATIDTIAFDIPIADAGHDAGVWSIAPATSLPSIVGAVLVDATSQPGYSATPVVAIDGSGQSVGLGLQLAADDLVVRGLAVGHAPSTGVVVTGDRVSVEDSHIGTDAAGTIAAPNGARGIEVLGADVVLRRLVVSANANDGVVFANASGGLIVDSLIGTDVTGGVALGNGEEGVQIEASDGVVIGQPGAGNVISGNGYGGINGFLGTSSGVTVQSNLIGVGLDGSTAMPNGNTVAEGGITIRTNASGWLIGGTGSGEGNVIANNVGDGVQLIDVNGAADDIAVLGNRIVGNSGLAIDHRDDGVTANDAGDADVGVNDLLNAPVITRGSELLPGIIGVFFDLDVPVSPDGYRLEFFANPTGIDPSGRGETEVFLGSMVVPGSGSSVFQYAGSLGDDVSATVTEIDGAGFGSTSEVSVTFALTGADTVVVNSTGDAGDAVPGNGVCDTGGDNSELDDECTLRAAIEEANATADIDTIEFAIPGTDPGEASGVWTISPATALPNIVEPVTIDGATQPGAVANTNAAPLPLSGAPAIELLGAWDIGDGLNIAATAPGTAIHGLVIGGFNGPDDYGIQVDADDVTITGSYIGVRVDGATNNANAYGIVVDAARTTIGGVDPADRNLIAGDNNAQILLDTGIDTVILGNILGADSSTTTIVGTWGSGIQAWNGSGLILGSVAAPNVIGAPDGEWGIELGVSGVIEGNLFGTDATYTADLGSWAAIDVYNAPSAVIRGNVIGNWLEAIIVESDDVTISGNFIGTDPSGTIDIGNSAIAVQVGTATDAPTGVMIGGTGSGDGNLIAYNDVAGVVVENPGTRASILGNSLRNNGGLGIDLGDDGVTANDAGDGDTGANQLLNHPVLRAASAIDAAVVADYELDVPAGTYRVEIFANPSGVDPTGNGEGERFVGADVVVHPGGDATYSVMVPGSVGDVLSATVTEDFGAGSFGSTSEFSAVRTAVADGLMVLDRSRQRSDLVTAGGLGSAVDGTGLVAGGLDFSGATERLIGPPTEITSGGLTLSGWIRPTDRTTDATIVSKRTIGGGAIYELAVDGSTGEAVARLGAGATIEARGGSVNTGSWHQVAATWDGSTLSVYVDGAEVASASAVGALATDVGAPVVLGNDSVSSAGVDGALDQIEVSHVARSAEWIETAYHNVSAPTAMVSIGAAETGTPGEWTTSTSVVRSGSHALSAPETSSGADAWAVATGIDEPGLVFESWWFLTDPSSTIGAAGTNTGDAPTDQREVAVGPAGLALGAIDGAVTTTEAIDPATIAVGTWTQVEIRTDELGNSSVWLDGVEIIPATAHSAGETGGSAGLRAGQLLATEQWYVDDVRIRRYVSDEPETTLGPIDRR